MEISQNIPFVAVWMVTYNHEKYIAQAIEGIVIQKTTFKFKLFIGEDCSTDNTRSVCIEYKNKFPNIIELIFTSKNSMRQNAQNIYSACFSSPAKYIAMCEGDDYWIDPLKLQKQVDFLEANPDFAICHHKVRMDSASYKDSIVFSPTQKETSTFEELCEGNYIYTPSCVFRNGNINKFPDFFFKCAAADWPLYLLNAEHGKIKYIDEPMAAYRIHGGGIWSQLEDIAIEYKCLKTIKLCMNYFSKRYRRFFLKGTVPKYIRLVKLYRKKNFLAAIYFFIRLLAIQKYNTFAISKKEALKLLILG